MAEKVISPSVIEHNEDLKVGYQMSSDEVLEH